VNFRTKTRIALTSLFVLAGAPALPCDSLVGAWELVYAVYKDDSGKIVAEIKGGAEKSLKILSKRHFSFITQDKAGKFEVAGAGTYSLAGSKYTEVVSYTSMDRLMGKTYRFDCAMKDGLWIHTGKEDHLQIEEHWKPLN